MTVFHIFIIAGCILAAAIGKFFLAWRRRRRILALNWPATRSLGQFVGHCTTFLRSRGWTVALARADILNVSWPNQRVFYVFCRGGGLRTSLSFIRDCEADLAKGLYAGIVVITDSDPSVEVIENADRIGVPIVTVRRLGGFEDAVKRMRRVEQRDVTGGKIDRSTRGNVGQAAGR